MSYRPHAERWTRDDEQVPTDTTGARYERVVPFDPHLVDSGPIATAASYTHTYSWEDTNTPLAEVIGALVATLPPLERACVTHGVLSGHNLTDAAGLVPHNPLKCERETCAAEAEPLHLGVDRKTLKKYRDSGLARLKVMLTEPWVLALVGRELPNNPQPDPLASEHKLSTVLSRLSEMGEAA